MNYFYTDFKIDAISLIPFMVTYFQNKVYQEKD
jgi:hypothetical protein